MTRTLCFAVTLAVVFACATAHAQDDDDEPEEGQSAPMKIEAEKHFNLALKLFQKENFRAAADQLAKAYSIEARDDILFAWAQAERIAGDCEKATLLYHRLRNTEDPLSDQDRLGVLEGLERCGAFEEAEKAQEEAERAASEGTPWYSDWLGDTLLVTGIVGLGVGSSYWLISSSEQSDAKKAFGYENHLVLEDNARRHRFVALAAFSLGGALITGAIVRYILRDDGSSPGPQSDIDVTATGWIGDDAGGFAVGGRF